MNLKASNFSSQAGLITAVLLAMLLISTPALMAEETETPAAQPAAADADSAVQFESAGMQIPFDGTSVETFEKSLETIKGETTDAEFETLQNALDYLLVYDLGARRDRELLYKRLDGKTPAEVVNMVKWRLEGRNPGAS